MFLEIKKSPTADSRTCDVTTVSKEKLLESSHQHILDVCLCMGYLSERLKIQAEEHDRDKITAIDQFYQDFKTKFEQHSWWDNHKQIQKHHLSDECLEIESVTLLDVLEHVVDCVTAGMARAGSVYTIKVAPEILQIAVSNTVDMLVRKIVVVD